MANPFRLLREKLTEKQRLRSDLLAERMRHDITKAQLDEANAELETHRKVVPISRARKKPATASKRRLRGRDK